jgi:hypothetical protein
MSASLQNEFISETYTSLLHLSGGGLNKTPKRDVYDGEGNITGLALSGTKVLANNVELPEQHVASLEAANNQITSLVDMFFPVGSIQITTENDDPGSRIPGTVWERVAEGRFLVGTGGVNPSNSYGAYDAGDNAGGMGLGHDGQTSVVSLIKEQMPKHTHTPVGYNAEYGNILTWTSGPWGDDQRTIGPVDQEVPNTQGETMFDPIYAFPAAQPIAQTLSEEGGRGGGAAAAFSTSPISYGAYIWRRTE